MLEIIFCSPTPLAWPQRIPLFLGWLFWLWILYRANAPESVRCSALANLQPRSTFPAHF